MKPPGHQLPRVFSLEVITARGPEELSGPLKTTWRPQVTTCSAFRIKATIRWTVTHFSVKCDWTVRTRSNNFSPPSGQISHRPNMSEWNQSLTVSLTCSYLKGSLLINCSSWGTPSGLTLFWVYMLHVSLASAVKISPAQRFVRLWKVISTTSFLTVLL